MKFSSDTSLRRLIQAALLLMSLVPVAVVGWFMYRSASTSLHREAAARLDAAMSDMDDAVERVSFGTRQFLNLATSDPAWGWALFRAAWALPMLREQVIAYARADLLRGRRQGVFKIEIDAFTVEMFASMVMTALFARLSGSAGEDAGSKAAELQLRMLGVAPVRARRAAWRRLERLAL